MKYKLTVNKHKLYQFAKANWRWDFPKFSECLFERVGSGVMLRYASLKAHMWLYAGVVHFEMSDPWQGEDAWSKCQLDAAEALSLFLVKVVA